ncbi:MAG: carboxypeptidase-like regulatory domain-containing protein [Dehalococcoidales bacterium]
MHKKFIVLFTSILLTVMMLDIACVSHTTTPIVGIGEIHVRVTDTDNNPLGGGKVVSDEQPDGQLKLEGLTDNNGDVVFQNIKSGEYEFYISRFNYTETYININVKPGQTTSTSVQMIISNPPLTTPTTN